VNEAVRQLVVLLNYILYFILMLVLLEYVPVCHIIRPSVQLQLSKVSTDVMIHSGNNSPDRID